MLAAVLELAPSGVEQVEGEGFVEYAVYGAPGELPELALGEAEVGGVLVTVSGTEVPDDWAERWKRFHSPVLVGGRLWVRPPWEEPAVRPGVIDLVIDPGRAFGTGAHPTTRLCLELLLDLELEGRSFCDLGCGSGVLSIAAAKLGAVTRGGARLRPAGGGGHGGQRARQRGGAGRGAAREPARGAVSAGRRDGGQPHAPAAAAGGGADGASRRGR